jgi:hypothetical protein
MGGALAHAHADDGLDHELALVRSAIALLGSGGARRVTLVGLHHAAELLPEVQPLAWSDGLLVRLFWRPSGCDISIGPAG